MFFFFLKSQKCYVSSNILICFLFNLNFHQITWDDVIGEPDGIKSPECAWRLSALCFRFSRNGCYVLLSVIVAPIVALFLGITFACLAFEVSFLFDRTLMDHFVFIIFFFLCVTHSFFQKIDTIFFFFSVVEYVDYLIFNSSE